MSGGEEELFRVGGCQCGAVRYALHAAWAARSGL
jgi:hypothetical protein